MAENQEGGPASPSTSVPAVLIVEDEFLVALDLETRVRDLGYGVLGPVASLAEAAALVATTRPSAVLLDVALQDGRSGCFAQTLRDAGISFAVTTGYGQGQLAEEILRSAPRLEKPYADDALKSVLITLLGRA